MAETYTRDQLVEEAARKLQLFGAGQALDSEDSDIIDAKVDALIEQLAADNVVEIDDLTEIPAHYFLPLGQLLANVCAEDFGVQYSEVKKYTFEKQLHRTAASAPTYETLRADYY